MDADALLRFVSRVQRLEALPRTGWVVSGVVGPESIAAHSYGVAVIALWLADHQSTPVDTELVLRIALLHDVGEAMTTDLPRPAKKFIGAETSADAEARALGIVLGEAPARWVDDARAYADHSLEARVVHAADAIQMYTQAAAYAAQGRGDLRRFWDRFPPEDHGVEGVAEIYERLGELHLSGWYPADFD